MNQNLISQDDPRLTAYAFNEMTPAERAEFETLLQQDAAARRAVEEIRAAGAMLATALEQEPSFAGSSGDAPATTHSPAAEPKPAGGKIMRFPQLYYFVSGLAAACFAVFFAYWQQNHVLETKQYVVLDLAKVHPAAKTAAAETVVTLSLPAPEPTPEPVPAVTIGSLRNEVMAEQNGAVAPARDRAAGEEDQRYGYEVATAGRQLRTELKDMGAAAAVTTREFLASAAASKRAQSPQAAATEYGDTVWGAVPRGPGAPRVDPDRQFNTEAYGYHKDNDFLRARDNPLSTFSIDVDTASYANMRRFLNEGHRPPADAVRVEELVNYFPYRYQPPTGSAPFAANLEVAAAPWAPGHRLVRIGLKGREVSDAARPAANLVFLLDVSGSMDEPNKLPLVKQSLRLLVDKLRADDRVAIAVYAGASGLALPSTPASHKAEILEAIDRLEAEGSTNGAMGIQLAYDIAKANFVTGGVNRVILATDGDFNVGVTSEGELIRLIGEKAKSGVFLSVLGFGMGNLKDATLEQLADKGNGNYAYIDSLAEARKTLVEQAGGTLVTIAKDVKIQVEFNPAEVQAYRLIGYENRLLAKEDFKNDQVDAGEIGAGHTVTALYEVVPVGIDLAATPGVDPLKYQKTEDRGQKTEDRKQKAAGSDELLTVKIRYKEPAGDTSRQLDFPLRDGGARFENASEDFKFAAAVAGFGMILRDSPHKGTLTLADISAWGREGTGSDAGGYRSEFLGLVQKAQPLVQ